MQCMLSKRSGSCHQLHGLWCRIAGKQSRIRTQGTSSSWLPFQSSAQQRASQPNRELPCAGQQGTTSKKASDAVSVAVAAVGSAVGSDGAALRSLVQSVREALAEVAH